MAAASEDVHHQCTCQQASKSPLLLEYAYRDGVCPGAPADLGPGFATTDCLEDINKEYNFEGAFNGARPVVFNASTAREFPVFNGVQFARLPPDEVTERWTCSKANGCYDCDAKSAPAQCSDARGFAMLWVPHGSTAQTPRILYVHGGSWLTGSPTSQSYAPFCAMIATKSGMPVLAIDYTLAPLGNFSRILRQLGAAVHWLATHDPTRIVAGESAADAHVPPESAPLLFIAGDSSGGGSATSALLAQASPGGLPGARGARLSGGVLFSPWFNLRCDTPSYVSQIYKLETRPVDRAHEAAGCLLHGLSSNHTAKVAIGGDVAFTDYPYTLATRFAQNGELYAGDAAMTTDPIASPTHALAETLAKMPPVQIHVGLSEVLVSENVIFATKMAAAGAACELHTYDAMWHVFSMYYEGCEHPQIQELLFAYSSLNMTAAFLQALAKGELPWTHNGIPYTLTHYEYPRGVDTAIANYHSLLEESFH